MITKSPKPKLITIKNLKKKTNGLNTSSTPDIYTLMD
eukprot:CAMPEP_0204821280 /NCGR_PEP_ID=MMETSP1018-20131115/6666_1 /ASSEMBLY_ACC=CAM_ASM_000518 /TAXON_ID=46462 /ORGANISM="Anophryoides haemophila, Strain AH6" /LENGTH=36 /DNA_ID= /DNA_START= /DNA_END= /DNA_ORIENTATION=